MPAFFSSDGPYLLQFLVIFAVIVVLMMAGYLIYRRVGGRGLSLSTEAGNRSRPPRLGIVDIYELDRQRQLILLRRDDVEHLILIGGPNDVVVERNVQRGAGARPTEPMLRPEPAVDAAADRPDSPREPAAAFPPRFEMPATVPPSGARSDVRPPALDQSLIAPDADELAPAAPSVGARAGRLLRRTPPPLVNLRPTVDTGRSRQEAEPAAPPPVLSSSEPRSVDPAILSDMTRQLEAALRRPASAVTPPRDQPARPTLPPPPASTAPDPIAAGMAASQVLSPLPEPSQPEPPPALALADASSRADPVVDPAPASPFLPSPPSPPSSSPPMPPGPDASGEAGAKQGASAFSVEEIEAEFARLLGRTLDKKN